MNDIFVNSDAPVFFAVAHNAHVGHRFGRRSSRQCVLLIGGELIADPEVLLDRVADGVQTAVPVGVHDRPAVSRGDRRLRHDAVHLAKMAFGNSEVRRVVHVAVRKHFVHRLRRQLAVRLVRDLFHRITDLLPHLLGKDNGKILLEHIGDAALTGLAVDADDIRIVGPGDVLGIDGQVGHGPLVGIVDILVSHSLGDRILMGAGKCAEDQVPRIRLPRVYLHSGQALIGLADLGHIGEVELRIDAIGEQIHRHCDQVHIPGPLSVSKERALHAVRARQYAELCIRHTAAAVIVGMKAEHDAVPVLEVFVQVFDLGGKNVRHGRLHRRRNIDDGLPVRIGLPDIEHRIADLQGILHFRSVEALRAVFKHEIAVCLVGQLLEELRAIHGELFDLFLILFKDLLALGNGSRIIQMDDRLRRALYGFKSLADDMLPGLGQHLDGHIVRDHISLDQ